MAVKSGAPPVKFGQIRWAVWMRSDHPRVCISGVVEHHLEEVLKKARFRLVAVGEDVGQRVLHRVQLSVADLFLASGNPDARGRDVLEELLVAFVQCVDVDRRRLLAPLGLRALILVRLARGWGVLRGGFVCRIVTTVMFIVWQTIRP